MSVDKRLMSGVAVDRVPENGFGIVPMPYEVKVKVTNCWKNRILGDWKVPADQKITWTLYPFYHNDKEAPLMESGLLGPVRLLSSESITLKP